ncbi:hypothetical protein [Thermoleptolyngbya sp. M55_K2018_002]|uniref:hypothetical protein n=1 Tax=Thermoleptolyngbya sp. M55_K2018_002 TaxID=2747808 RepID=UPI001A014707|nr:hypothetical protein [Thermoleptolyngbya sp. M55_K2018_002]HIK39776.1 hypothetical protein [Thermoleptolyngbya sp. M55_K2018_002]
MLKTFVSVPALAFLCALVVRGMAAPLQQSLVKADTVSQNRLKHDDSAPSVPEFEIARTSLDAGVRGAINARAIYLFTHAQKQPDAIAWADQHARTVAGDLAFLRQSLGQPTGEAAQFAEVLNRSAEFAAACLALHWLKHGGIDYSRSNVSLDQILQHYQEVFNRANEQQQPAG